MAGKRAEAAIAGNPEKSDRAIAAEIGVNQSTRARKRTDADASVGKRVGQDGKARRMPQRTAVPAAKVETISVDDFDADDGVTIEMVEGERRQSFAGISFDARGTLNARRCRETAMRDARGGSGCLPRAGRRAGH